MLEGCVGHFPETVDPPLQLQVQAPPAFVQAVS